MKVGVAFPPEVTRGDPDRVAAVARAAEAAGATHLRLYDHVLGAEREGRDPPLRAAFDEATPVHEILVLAGYLAGVTREVELALGVLVLPARPVALVAKQLAEVALLAGGRLRVGLGTGWNHVEFAALGAPFAGRGRLLDEQVDVLRALWSGEVVRHESGSHHLDRVAIAPVPPQPLSLWFGGFGPRAWDRAARHGDGFQLGADLAEAEAAVPELRRHLERYGRAEAPFGIDVLVRGDGDLDRWRDDLARAERLGATHVTASMPRAVTDPDTWIAMVHAHLDSAG